MHSTHKHANTSPDESVPSLPSTSSSFSIQGWNMRPEYDQTNDYGAFYLFIHHFTLIYSCLSIYQPEKKNLKLFPFSFFFFYKKFSCWSRQRKTSRVTVKKSPKRDYWGSSYPWIPSSHSGTSPDTSSCPIYIDTALLGLVTIYLVTHHHLGGYLCPSQERNSVWLPTNTPKWIIITSI